MNNNYNRQALHWKFITQLKHKNEQSKQITESNNILFVIYRLVTLLQCHLMKCNYTNFAT